mgnify:CR=1 FL=1
MSAELISNIKVTMRMHYYTESCLKRYPVLRMQTGSDSAGTRKFHLWFTGLLWYLTPFCKILSKIILFYFHYKHNSGRYKGASLINGFVAGRRKVCNKMQTTFQIFGMQTFRKTNTAGKVSKAGIIMVIKKRKLLNNGGRKESWRVIKK